MDNGLDGLNYMPFPIAPQLHHQYMGQHQHPHNMPLLQAVTQMHQSQSGLGVLQSHGSGLDFVSQHGPVDPHQHLQALQHSEMPDHLPRRRSRKREEVEASKPKKRQRSKKPVDAPTRPKSAYMFFLGEFREQYKIDNPDSKKVAEVASAAGEKWRSLPEAEKKGYEEASEKAKADYRVVMTEYEKDHPKPPRRQKRARDPTELKRPQSAYFFFLADFREMYKKDHPDEPVAVKVIGREAGERWKAMSSEEKEPYELLSTGSKAEYARLKQLTPAERIMVLAAQAMHHPDGSLVVPAYMDAISQAQHVQHGMMSHLNPHMGLNPNADPQLTHGLAHSLQQEEEEQYDEDDDNDRNSEEGPENSNQEGQEEEDGSAEALRLQQEQQQRQQQVQQNLAAAVELAARARNIASPRADPSSPAHAEARHRSDAQLASHVPPSRTRDSAELQEQAQEQGSLRGSPDIIPQRPPIHVHVTGHTPVPSQLQQHHQQQRQQQQQQAQSMMPRVAHYQQSPNAMLHFQHYQPDLAQSQQQQGLALGIHQYQQHPDGLMHFQHQPNLPAMQQHQQQQMHGGGGVLGSSLAHQLQERGQYFDTAEHEAAASQPVMPMSYAQWNSPPSGY